MSECDAVDREQFSLASVASVCKLREGGLNGGCFCFWAQFYAVCRIQYSIKCPKTDGTEFFCIKNFNPRAYSTAHPPATAVAGVGWAASLNQHASTGCGADSGGGAW